MRASVPVNDEKVSVETSIRPISCRTRLKHFPSTAVAKCTMSNVLLELDGRNGGKGILRLRGLELDNLRMKRELGCLDLFQGRIIGSDVWACNSECCPIWLHQSHSEAFLDQNN